jgi:hypothetical protein
VSTFIRAVEVWLPSADGTLLDHAGGIYDAAPALGFASRGLCFGRGEGLPGRAWDEGRPVLLREFEAATFRRTEAARDAGLRGAVALPFFAGGSLTSVAVLFWGAADEREGAVELWQNDPRISTDLTLADGAFGAGAAELEALTRDGSLARGAGAPGQAWQREAAVFVDDITRSRGFLRAQVAAQAGIARALAVPCSVRAHEIWVLNLLSSTRHPVARRIESWLPDEAGMHMERAFGFCEVQGRMPADGRAEPVEALGPVGRVLQSGAAEFVRLGPGDPADWAARAAAAGLQAALVMPVMAGAVVSEVIVLQF